MVDLLKIPTVEIRKKLFKMGSFDFITTIEGKVHKKQQEALKLLTDYETTELGYGGAAGGAKAQPLNAIVYTPFGKKKIGDIKIGDVVCHPSGCNTTVIAIHPQGVKKIYEVEFSDGAKTRVTGDHLWYVWFASDKSKQEVKSTKGKIQTTEMLLSKLNKKPIIPLCKPVQFTLPVNKFIKKSVIDPYILGVLIGDGSLTKQVSFSSADDFIVQEVTRLLPKGYSITTDGKYNYNIISSTKGKNGIYDQVRTFGLNCKSPHKSIPDVYFHSTLNERIALAQGLMDTDGTIDVRGHASFCSASKKLALDVQYLIRSLGFKATISAFKTKCLPAYRIYIQGSNTEILFRLPRKKQLSKPYNGGVSESGRRMVSIKEVGEEICQCITVDNPNGLYITDDFIVTHNSWTGCSWLGFMAECYPETRWFIGREELKRLRDSTLITFFKISRAYGLTDWKYNGQDHFLQFNNGSRIDLLDLKYLPSDPLYERYGSIEYTGGWIEEAGETHFAAYDTLKSRIGRHMNDEYGLLRKLYATFNPKKNYVDTYFYRPFEKGTLPPGRRFIKALIRDNPHVEKDYEKVLQSITSEVARQRLLFGNFDYDDDPSALCDYDAICDMFTNDHAERGERAISADLAMKGRDRFVVGDWDGMVCTIEIDKLKATGKEIEEDLRRVMAKSKIGHSQTVADSDGMGSYLESYIEGIKEFHGGSTAINSTEFANLKSECGYKLAEFVNKRAIKIICTPEQRERITVEMGVLKADDIDADTKKKRIISKDKMKELLQGSPDYLDMLLMKMIFHVEPITEWVEIDF